MNRLAVFVLVAVGCLSSGAFEVEQVFRPERFSRGDTNVRKQQEVDEAAWIWMKGLDVWGAAVFTETRPQGLESVPSYFVRFRKDFTAIEGEALELDVSADERYVLLLDGREISRGPHRGLANRWHYQSYRITGLTSGEHRLDAVCWQLGAHAPLAQITLRGGFILKAAGPYDEVLTTGKAAWKVGRLVGTTMTGKANPRMFGVGSCCSVKGTSFLDEEPADWTTPEVVRAPAAKTYAGLIQQGWMLFPTVLRDMMFAPKTPGRIVRGENVLKRDCVIPPHTKVEAIWDLGDYYCAYPFAETAGGRDATMTWMWTECLTDEQGRKGDRSAWENLDAYHLNGDVFRCDGRAGARFTTPWWRCGKWCKIVIETAEEPLTLRKVEMAETRYPVEMMASFDCDDPFVTAIQPLCARALEMCMHEHFFDCPYYEQQMYPGDSRVQYLVSGLFDTEDRTVRNAITLFDCDRRENGMTSFNCPTRGTQEGFGFACCEVMMHGDYAFQHTNRAWLKERAAGMNHTLMGFESFAREDGLLVKTPGWNFVDWVPRWNGGTPPGANDGHPNAEINLQYLMALQAAVKVEEALGESALATHWRERAERVSAAIKREFWTPARSLFASTAARTDFSEHAQCLALLCDVVTGEDAERCFLALVGAPNLDRGTIYYKHYLFSTYFKFGRGDLFFKNLGFWKDCAAWGASTIFENPWIDSRSDCHGWGSHPLWHLHTGVAGVQSDAPWYGKVKIAPHPGHLSFIKSATPTPKGSVLLDLRFENGTVEGTVKLPDGLPGTFVWRGETIPLAAGETTPVSLKGAFPVETAKWQRAIDTAAEAGGGCVTIPAGRHPVGQLNLRSNVELHLEKDAVLEGVVGLDEYGIETLPCSEGTLSAIVMAQNVTNVAVTGEGMIFGNGRSWPQPKDYGGNQEGLRARGLVFAECRDVRLEDFTLRDTGCWGCVLKCCDGVSARRVKIDNHSNANNDGFDIEAKNVVIEDCIVDSEDDAYCLKSNNPDFTIENVIIRRCTGRSHCNAFKLGTASHGIVRNVRVEHCKAEPPSRDFIDERPFSRTYKKNWFHRPGYDDFPNGIGYAALAIENVDGGSVTEFSIDDVEESGYMAAIFVRGGTRTGRACGTPPGKWHEFKDLAIANVRGSALGPWPSVVSGVPGCPVRNLSLRNIDIVCRGAGEARSRAALTTPVPEIPGAYPEINMFGKCILPAYGLYVENAPDLKTENLRFTLEQGTEDVRPAIFGCGNADRAGPIRVALTFDDSLKDHLLIAAPMLEARGWRGTFNIVTDWVGRGEDYLTWDDVRELLRRGHEVTTHTKTHPALVELLDKGQTDRVRAELAESRDRIISETGFAPRFLCTPYCQQNDETDRLCREANLQQMNLPRFNFGSNNCDRVAAVVDELAKKGVRQADFLHHGIAANEHGGWCPFLTRESFEHHLDAIAALERDGRIVVTDYDGAASKCRLAAKDWPHHGVVALSFDDRNFSDWRRALPIFARYGARATFCVCGEIADDGLAFMREALAGGHEIALHGLRHRDADQMVAEQGETAYWQAEIEPQLAVCRMNAIPVRTFAYPNCRRTDQADKVFLDRGFTRLRGRKGKVSIPQPHDPKGVRLAEWKPLVSHDPSYLPAVDYLTEPLLPNVILGENYHTKPNDILASCRRAGDRAECLSLVSHGISPDAKGISMKTEWLERLLTEADDAGVIVRGLR